MPTDKVIQEYVAAVVEMRRLQRLYFKIRDTDSLMVARRAEARVDAFSKTIHKLLVEPSLFETEKAAT